MAMDVEDVMQEMRIHIMKVVPKYDPSKGASLSTFIYMAISRRLSDLKSKSIRQGKYWTDTLDGLATKISMGNSGDKEGFESAMNYLEYKSMASADNLQEDLADMIDVRQILSDLKAEDRELFLDRYLEGYSLAELCEKHSRSTENIRQKLRRVEKIFNTLRFQ